MQHWAITKPLWLLERFSWSGQMLTQSAWRVARPTSVTSWLQAPLADHTKRWIHLNFKEPWFFAYPCIISIRLPYKEFFKKGVSRYDFATCHVTVSYVIVNFYLIFIVLMSSPYNTCTWLTAQSTFEYISLLSHVSLSPRSSFTLTIL